MSEQFNWYKKPTGTQRFTALACVYVVMAISIKLGSVLQHRHAEDSVSLSA